jgi:hypothetical protein
MPEEDAGIRDATRSRYGCDLERSMRPFWGPEATVESQTDRGLSEDAVSYSKANRTAGFDAKAEKYSSSEISNTEISNRR